MIKKKAYITFFTTLIICQTIVILLLLIRFYKLTNKTIYSIEPINKENIVFSPNGNLRYFYEPKANSTEKIFGPLNGVDTNTFNLDTLNEKEDYVILKPKDTYRIITLGDSFTYGAFVSNQANWPKKLEYLLNSSYTCSNFRKIEVINLGVYGYDLQYEIERFKKRGIKYSPDLIVWFLKDNNIDRVNELMIPTHDQMVNKLTTDTRFIKKNINTEPPLAWEKTVEEISKNYGRAGILSIQKKILNDFNNYYQGKLFIFTFPTTKEGNKNLIKDFALLRNNTYYFDQITNIYSNRDKYVLNDGHPNEGGYKVIAEDLFKYLTEKKIIPCN